MSRFLDIYMPAKVPGYPCVSSPRFNTTIQVSAGGNERSTQEWEHPLHRFILPEGARSWEVVQGLGHHWKITRGPHRTFPWRDPLDFASRDLDLPDHVPAIAATDQVIGTADGFTDRFQLTKTYSIGAETYERPIHLPVVDSVAVAIDGVVVPEANYSVSRPGGEVQFLIPPAVVGPGLGVISAGFLFDVEVRFESDDAFEGILRTFAHGGFADITLIEVRPC